MYRSIKLNILISVVLIFTQACNPVKDVVNKDESSTINTTEEIEPFSDLATTGGASGEVIKVTNLNLSGKGSLKAALESDFPRIIVFEVGGVIDLQMTNLTISNPNVTVAGYTAPFPGITLIKGGLIITTHDVIIKHLKIRPGDAGQEVASGWEPDGITIYGENAHHILIDHCSITWAVDENLSMSGNRFLGVGHTSRNVVLSNNIIAEALSVSSHAEGEHSKGTLVFDNSQNVLITGNLYAQNKDRNPFFKANTTGVIVNNLIVNPGSAAIRAGYPISEWEGVDMVLDNPTLDVIGNVLFAGSATGNKFYLLKGDAYAYGQDNILQGDGFNLFEFSPEIIRNDEQFFNINGLLVIPANDVIDEIVLDVGAFPALRDEIDERVVKEAVNNSGSIINSQSEVGGYPNFKPQFRQLDVPAVNVETWLSNIEKNVLR